MRETDPQRQVIEVLRRFDMRALISPFKRCIRCNGQLRAVDKTAIGDRLPPRTREYYDEFHVCDGCGKVYWKGSHYQRLVDFITQLYSPA